jgi:hypothetical protein
MNIVEINDVKYLVFRNVGTDKSVARKIKKSFGGTLIKDVSGKYMICTKVEDIEYEEV